MTVDGTFANRLAWFSERNRGEQCLLEKDSMKKEDLVNAATKIAMCILSHRVMHLFDGNFDND